MPMPRQLLVCVLSLLVTSTACTGGTYYVAPDGDDANTGQSLDKPFKTIQKAAEVAQPGDTVMIRAGTYRETVVPARSGTPEARITFQPYASETVILSGAAPLTGFKHDARGIWVADMPADFFTSTMNQADQIFVDGKMMILAQWPNTTLDVSQPVKSCFTKFVSKTRKDNLTTGVFEDAALPAGLDVVGAEIFLQPNFNAWSWGFTGTITRRDGAQLTLSSPNDSGKDAAKGYDPKSRYILYNKRSLLDAPGEWFHDRAAGKLYLIPPNQDDPNRHVVEAKQRDYAFNLSDRSYITIKGLNLFACTITTDVAAGGSAKGHDDTGKMVYPWRGKKTVAASKGVVIQGVQARYLNHFTDRTGHFYLQWGSGTGIVLSGEDHVIQDCVLQYSAGNGIQLLGHRHKVRNNVLADMSYAGVDCAAINSATPAPTMDHEIAHNTVVRCARSGITPRSQGNSDPKNLVARIHHNHIAWCGLQDWDAGGIYFAGTDARWLRMDHNVIHDVHGFINAGIYPDFSKNMIIDHNLVYNCEWAIHVQGAYNPGGAGTGTVNNTLIYNNTLACRDTSRTGWGPFGIGGGKSQNPGTVIANNILYILEPQQAKKYTSPYSDNFKEAKFTHNLEWDAKPGSATDPKFVSASRFDFRLQHGSPAIDAGEPFAALTYDGVEVPAFNDPVQGKAPDLGAFEFGVEPWRAGSNLPQAAEFLRQGATMPGDKR